VPIAFGADSVASALHLRSGATPRGRAQIIMTLRAGRSKAELFILQKTGTSHFALTQNSLAIDTLSGPEYYSQYPWAQGGNPFAIELESSLADLAWLFEIESGLRVDDSAR
jgi:hypothetical protein